jgi:hypothetical protein
MAGRLKDAAALYPASEDMLGLGFQLMWAGAALPRTTAGIAATCAQHRSRAEEHHQTAIRPADSLALKVCQPIARYWYADMLLVRDEAADRTRARSLLNEVLAMCESLGAPLYARQASEKFAAVSTKP